MLTVPVIILLEILDPDGKPTIPLADIWFIVTGWPVMVKLPFICELLAHKGVAPRLQLTIPERLLSAK